jgi:hypothetical protein
MLNVSIIENKNEIKEIYLTSKLTGERINDFKNYFKLNKEIIRCKGNLKISTLIEI